MGFSGAGAGAGAVSGALLLAAVAAGFAGAAAGLAAGLAGGASGRFTGISFLGGMLLCAYYQQGSQGDGLLLETGRSAQLNSTLLQLK